MAFGPNISRKTMMRQGLQQGLLQLVTETLNTVNRQAKMLIFSYGVHCSGEYYNRGQVF